MTDLIQARILPLDKSLVTAPHLIAPTYIADLNPIAISNTLVADAPVVEAHAAVMARAQTTIAKPTTVLTDLRRIRLHPGMAQTMAYALADQFLLDRSIGNFEAKHPLTWAATTDAERDMARKGTPQLAHAYGRYGTAIFNAYTARLAPHRAAQDRVMVAVPTPSLELRAALDKPPAERTATLGQSPVLTRELITVAAAFQQRLTPAETTALAHGDRVAVVAAFKMKPDELIAIYKATHAACQELNLTPAQLGPTRAPIQNPNQLTR